MSYVEPPFPDSILAVSVMMPDNLLTPQLLFYFILYYIPIMYILFTLKVWSTAAYNTTRLVQAIFDDCLLYKPGDILYNSI